MNKKQKKLKVTKQTLSRIGGGAGGDVGPKVGKTANVAIGDGNQQSNNITQHNGGMSEGGACNVTNKNTNQSEGDCHQKAGGGGSISGISGC